MDLRELGIDLGDVRDRPRWWYNPAGLLVVAELMYAGLALVIMVGGVAGDNWDLSLPWQFWLYLAYGLLLWVGGAVLYVRGHPAYARQLALQAVLRRASMWLPGDWVWAAVAGVLTEACLIGALFGQPDLFWLALAGMLFGLAASAIVLYAPGKEAWRLAWEIVRAAQIARKGASDGSEAPGPG